MKEEQQIVIYKTEDGRTHLEVRLQRETLWLTQKQIAELFEIEVPAINKHISNIFETGELEEMATISKMEIVRKEGRRTVRRTVGHYNLDMIISVGYRVNSKRGTQFRIWANQILKDYLVRGFAINEKRIKESATQLDELKHIIRIQEKVFSAYALQTNEAEGLLHVISAYARALEMLDDYDHQRLKVFQTKSRSIHKITYKEAKRAIQKLGEQTGASALFGKEKDDSFKGSLENIYQTFDKNEVYPSVEEKAAHLLYFVVKNHSFTDGNKRIAAFLFVWFLTIAGTGREQGSKGSWPCQGSTPPFAISAILKARRIRRLGSIRVWFLRHRIVARIMTMCGQRPVLNQRTTGIS